MRRLINLKDDAHYGFHHLSAQNLRSAFTQADRLISFARAILAG
jgi:hypothetical protein